MLQFPMMGAPKFGFSRKKRGESSGRSGGGTCAGSSSAGRRIGAQDPKATSYDELPAVNNGSGGGSVPGRSAGRHQSQTSNSSCRQRPFGRFFRILLDQQRLGQSLTTAQDGFATPSHPRLKEIGAASHGVPRW